MEDRERLHRSEPQRTGPIRDFSNLYRPPRGSDDGVNVKESPPRAQQPVMDEGSAAAPHSVEAAYRIIQKHIDEGRQAARQLSQTSSVRGKVSEPLQQLLDRVVSLQGELLPLLLDVMRNLVQPPAQSPDNASSQHASAGTNGPSRAGPMMFEVVCHRPVEFSIDLREDSADVPLATPGLHALESNKPPLQEVSFMPANQDGRRRLRIVVPENQLPGTYSGIIINRLTGEVHGTLSLKISD